mmetsp:Transcript_588/g.1405  ORF Transcript_588/g.1405 Transcript_588/m.1405 type:complete len:281 (+) Transcript_588:2113-2955(+)
MIRGMRPPARTSSKRTSVFILKVQICSPLWWSLTTPSYGMMSITSPIFSLLTSISIGSAPESSIVLKKMGAILPPMHTPLVRLLGTYGMSSPMYHRTELVADLRDEPVPTTSPTYASGNPFSFSSAICAGASVMPSRGNLSIASACSGMSGRDQASGAGERSSVFVSPETRNTVRVSTSGTFGLLVNHSASAHARITPCAAALPARAFSSTSWKASKTRIVFPSASAAIGASALSSSASISGLTLYPPCIVPSIFTAVAPSITGQLAFPLAMAARKPAFT